MIGDTISRYISISCLFFVSLVYIAFIVKKITTITGPINAISVNNNSIALPFDIFDNLPVKIASFYYQNLSRWLPPHNPNQSIISPVLSSTNCTDCSITDLTTPVNIVFNLSSQQVQQNKLNCCHSNLIFLSVLRYQILIIYLVYIGSLNCI